MVMSKLEIKKLFEIRSGRYLPCGLNFIEKLWWRFVPGTIINVKWPKGDLVITEDNPLWDWTIGPSRYVIESADPNEHYRPWMEANVGRQGWDWNWGMANNDASDNRLTIKIRQKYKEAAVMAKLLWS
jgi:hypothetical protein